jgi:flagellin-like protein
MSTHRSGPPAERAVSPVIGTVLLLAIVLLLVAISGAFIFELTEQRDPAPQASLNVEPIESSDDYRLVHRSGDNITGDQLRLLGVSDSDKLAGTPFTAGDTIRLTPTEETIRLVWEEQRPSSYTLATFDVTLSSSSSSSSASLSESVAFTGTSGGILNITEDGGSTSTISTIEDPTGLGPASDIDTDGTVEVPYVDSNGDIRLVETDDGSETLLANDSDVSGSAVQTTATRLAVGTWNGSDESVFFANENEDTLYRVTPGGSVSEVASPGNGVGAVVGPVDIDGDGTDELAFEDGSATVRYIDLSADDTADFETTGVTVGQNNGIGVGSVLDYDSDGSEDIVVSGTGNQIGFVDSTGIEYVQDTDLASGQLGSTKSPPTVADVDDDGSSEIVYVSNGADAPVPSNTTRYLDNIDNIDVSGDAISRNITDDAGSHITGGDTTGTT